MPHGSQKKTVVLGGGITGLTIASELSKNCKDQILVVEKEGHIGGLAATITDKDLSFDLGSHRLHMESDNGVLAFIQETIGERLLTRPRHGKLFSRGKFMNYPPCMISFIRSCSAREFAGFAASYLKNVIQPVPKAGENYESAMIRSVGKRLYKAFFMDYAIKLWGCDPREISVDGKRKRSVIDFTSLKASILKRRHHYYYPRPGIGIIAKKLTEVALGNGVDIITNAQVKNISLDEKSLRAVTIERAGCKPERIEVNRVISTIPVDDLFGFCFSGTAIKKPLQWRGARMLHVLLDEKVGGDTETFYFPGADVLMGRVSEVRKYSPTLNESLPGSLLTIEVPSSPGDDIWQMEDQLFLQSCLQNLVQTGIFQKRPGVLKAIHMRLNKVYPIYQLGWEATFRHLYDRLYAIGNLYTVGRGGLYLHCNIDHCITQGLALSEHITKNNGTDRTLWNTIVEGFYQMSARD